MVTVHGQEQLHEKQLICPLYLIILINVPLYFGFIAENHRIRTILIGTEEAIIISGQQKVTCLAKKL
jgi:hypothetical protein